MHHLEQSILVLIRDLLDILLTTEVLHLKQSLMHIKVLGYRLNVEKRLAQKPWTSIRQ